MNLGVEWAYNMSTSAKLRSKLRLNKVDSIALLLLLTLGHHMLHELHFLIQIQHTGLRLVCVHDLWCILCFLKDLKLGLLGTDSAARRSTSV